MKDIQYCEEKAWRIYKSQCPGVTTYFDNIIGAVSDLRHLQKQAIYRLVVERLYGSLQKSVDVGSSPT